MTQLNMTSVAINIFVKKVTHENRRPFDLKTDPFYNASNMAELAHRAKSFDSGSAELITKSMEDLEAMANE